MRKRFHIPGSQKIRQKIALAINGTLLCILFIPFCVLFAVICIILSLTDHIFARIDTP